MSHLRMAFVAVSACLAIGAVGAPVAAAAKKTAVPPMFKVADVTGESANGKAFKGTYAVQRFVVRNGAVHALGTLKGKVGKRKVTRSGVLMPASLAGATGARAAQQTCPVLNLVLGPVDLNLLGLRVRLGGGTNLDQPIVLDITAIRGGGLLGDLVCGLSGLLNGPGILQQLSGQLQSLAATLNTLGSLLGGLQAGGR